MTPPSIRAGRRPEVLIASVVVGAVVVMLLVLRSLSKGDDPPPPPPPAEVAMTWTVRPAGSIAPASGHPEAEGHDLAIYLDISKSMRGFLPPPSHSPQISGFRDVVELVQVHLVSATGGGSRVRWYAFPATRDVVQGGDAPRIERQLFKGPDTPLASALAELTLSVQNGEVEAAALITDLKSSQAVLGAMGALRPLRAWFDSAAVRGGALHAGLLGVRSSYWGFSGPGCTAQGDLLCWYSEQLHGFRSLTGVAQAPFYVLVLGRGPKVVEDFGDRVRRGAQTLGLQTEWELLTAASLPRTVTATCTLAEVAHDGEPQQQQYALTRDLAGNWQCMQDDRIELSCELPPDAVPVGPRLDVSWWGQGAEVPESPLVSTPGKPGARSAGGQRVRVVLNCEQLRDKPPHGDLTLRLVGQPPSSSARRWDNWTSINDEKEQDISRTPQLADLVNGLRLRPTALELASSPLMRMTGAEQRR